MTSSHFGGSRRVCELTSSFVRNRKQGRIGSYITIARCPAQKSGPSTGSSDVINALNVSMYP